MIRNKTTKDGGVGRQAEQATVLSVGVLGVRVAAGDATTLRALVDAGPGVVEMPRAEVASVAGA